MGEREQASERERERERAREIASERLLFTKFDIKQKHYDVLQK
jgi:hypothetical protein